LSVGADINAKDHDDSTPLHKASVKGHLQVAKELMGHGADIEAKNTDGWTPLIVAASRVTCMMSRIMPATHLCTWLAGMAM
jgi:ankyrin repeat protein